jgi:hypothetical protein
MCFARIMHGFGCNLLAYDPFPNDQFPQYGKFVETLGLCWKRVTLSVCTVL